MRTGCGLVFLALLAIKLLWKWHGSRYGFHGFAQGVSLPLALKALNPFNTYYQPAQWLYLKAVLFASFDHVIKIPYVALYLAMAGLWHYLIKNWPDKTARFKKVMILYTGFMLVYLLMLYFLQAIVFGVGHNSPQILDFSRYYNMLFLPFLGMMVFISLDITTPDWYLDSRPAAAVALSLAMIMVTAGKIERTKKFYQPFNLYGVYAAINEHTSRITNKNWSICLSNPPRPEHASYMPLSFFFMPHRVIYPVNEDNKRLCDVRVTWKDENSLYRSYIVSLARS